MSIGKRILNIRLSQNINLSTLMNKTGLSTDFLFDLENDSVPFTVEDISKIASALNVYKSDIFSQWEEDYYEDFRNSKSDKEKLQIFKQFGVPEDLLEDYLILAFDNVEHKLKQEPEQASCKPSNPEPQGKPPFYKNSLFWTIFGVLFEVFKFIRK